MEMEVCLCVRSSSRRAVRGRLDQVEGRPPDVKWEGSAFVLLSYAPLLYGDVANVELFVYLCVAVAVFFRASWL